MLNPAENELLTRTGPGTPMGNLFRRFWLPALLPRELPEPDSDPIRFRLLGEDLIAFRDTNGTVGFLQNNCPHRGASLFFGRNEEAGLRCVYHGWKFDVTGQCVDMPNEPAESDFKTQGPGHRVSRRRSGAAWSGSTWARPRSSRACRNYEWCMQPNAEQSLTRKWLQDSNYSQGTRARSTRRTSRSCTAAVLRALRRDPGRNSFGAAEADGAGDGLRLCLRRAAAGSERPVLLARHCQRAAHVERDSIGLRARLGDHVIPQDDEHSWWFYVTPAPLAGEQPNLKDDRLTPGDASPAGDRRILPGTASAARATRTTTT